MLKAHEIIKQVFFTLDNRHGVVISKLSNGSYLVFHNDFLKVFTFEDLKNSKNHGHFVILPFDLGSKEFGSPFAVKPETFILLITEFARTFGEQ